MPLDATHGLQMPYNRYAKWAQTYSYRKFLAVTILKEFPRFLEIPSLERLLHL